MSFSNLLFNESFRAALSPLTNGRASEFIKPTVATAYLTKSCNSRCTMCDFWKNEADPQELNSEQWGIVFSRLKAFGIGYLGINASGEMFTRKDIFDILWHVRAQGIPFGINSNGTLLTASKVPLLAALQPRVVTIGLDGVGDEQYEVTRGLKTGFTTVSKNIQRLKAAGIKIGIGSVLMRDNINEWSNLCRYTLDLGLSGIRFTAYHDGYFNPISGAKEQSSGEPVFIAQAREEIEQIIAFKKQHGIVKNSVAYLKRVPDFYQNPNHYFPTPCLQGSNRIELDVFGNVTLCSFETKSLGNLLRQEMDEVWLSPEHKTARKNAYSGKCSRCFLSCYAEENLRLSHKGFLSTFADSLQRGRSLFSSNNLNEK